MIKFTCRIRESTNHLTFIQVITAPPIFLCQASTLPIYYYSHKINYTKLLNLTSVLDTITRSLVQPFAFLWDEINHTFYAFYTFNLPEQAVYVPQLPQSQPRIRRHRCYCSPPLHRLFLSLVCPSPYSLYLRPFHR